MRFGLVHGTSVVSKLIEWQTRGYWSHAFLLFSDDTVIESRERHRNVFTGKMVSGVQKLSFASWKIENEGTDFKIFYLNCSEVAIRKFAEAQVGKPYDYVGVLRFITRKAYSNQPDNKWWCSELVFQSILEEIALFNNTEGWEVNPQMLARTTKATE